MPALSEVVSLFICNYVFVYIPLVIRSSVCLDYFALFFFEGGGGRGVPILCIFNVPTDVIAHIQGGGCAYTLRESAVQVDSGRKIPCCTRDWNLSSSALDLMLNPLSHIPALSIAIGLALNLLSPALHFAPPTAPDIEPADPHVCPVHCNVMSSKT